MLYCALFGLSCRLALELPLDKPILYISNNKKQYICTNWAYSYAIIQLKITSRFNFAIFQKFPGEEDDQREIDSLYDTSEYPLFYVIEAREEIQLPSPS